MKQNQNNWKNFSWNIINIFYTLGGRPNFGAEQQSTDNQPSRWQNRETVGSADTSDSGWQTTDREEGVNRQQLMWQNRQQFVDREEYRVSFQITDIRTKTMILKSTEQPKIKLNLMNLYIENIHYPEKNTLLFGNFG